MSLSRAGGALEASSTLSAALSRGPPHPIDSETGAHMYRIAQEAISNAVRHGQAPGVPNFA